ncbi:MAG: glycosyltransferase family 4 protein [Ignavibacteriales bacterium]|nr:glycosyltransferase family 4 protein [Ignavibacteriales bacterium]
MNSRQKILIICPGARSPFVRSDAAILAKHYPTEILGVDTLPFPRKLVLLFRLLSLLLKGEVLMVLMYFSVPIYAPFVVTLAKLFGKKVVVITGGYDTTYVPVIDWGEMKTWWKRIAQRYALFMVDLVLCFSEFSKSDVLKYAKPKRSKALYFGIDTEYFKPSGPKEPLVITVCFQVNESTLIQKGLRTMIESARSIPEAQFVLIGETSNDAAVADARRTAPANVRFQDKFIFDEELLHYYQRATVYVQASAHEGFGIANAEAMSCECIPVVTNTTALPEVVGDAGFFVPFGDVPATAQAIRRALASPELGKKARARILENFTFDIHERTLLADVRSVIGH